MHLISPYSITPESNIKVKRMKKMTVDKTLWLPQILHVRIL